MEPGVDGEASARQQHWESVYAEKNADEVSWFEPAPSFSLAMFDAVGADPTMAVIDVGAGASRLAAALLRRGFTDITALDVAEDGLAVARTELGPDAERVTWVAADLLTWSPPRRFDIWHDRAVFHFLTSSVQQHRYVCVAQAALRPGGKLVVATFADDGPEQCSGLPAARYSPAQLVDTFNAHGGASFEQLDHRREEHHTPSGAVQPFTWVAFALRQVTCLPSCPG